MYSKIKKFLKHYVNLKFGIYYNKKYNVSLKNVIPQFSKLYNTHDIINNPYCSELEIDTNKLTSFILKDLIPVVGITPYPITEQLLMVAAVTYLKPDYIFEWGTHLGMSARIFSEISKKYNIETTIHSIDLPDDVSHIEHPGLNRGIMVKNIKNVNLYQGDGLEVSLDIAKKLPQNSKLLFFLDGDHEYETVKRELNGIFNKFPSVNIIIHDTFYQSFESSYNIGPHKAIDEFMVDKKDKFKTLSTNLGLPGMTLLYQNK